MKFNAGSRIAAAKDQLFKLKREELELKFLKAAISGDLRGAAEAALASGITPDEIESLVLGAVGSLRGSDAMTATLPRPVLAKVVGNTLEPGGRQPVDIFDGSQVDAVHMPPKRPPLIYDESDIEAARMKGGYSVDSVIEAAGAELVKDRPATSRFGHRYLASSVETSPSSEVGLADGLMAWLKTSPFVLQTPHRAAHKGIEALGMTLTTYRKDGGESRSKPDAEVIQVIQVDHDWGALFGASSTEGTGGEWHLPYNIQVFEFAISGAAVIAAINADPVVTSMSIGIRPPGKKSWVTDRCGVRISGDKWSLITHTDLPAQGDPAVNASFDRLYDFILAQVRATSIMLEAEVAIAEPIRAPYKSNQPPKDRKPLPLLSHHIVRLNRRPRAAALPAGSDHQPGSRKRLHFRRGHWRHYANHKTWICWMLAGNPDLGFVEKEYRT